MNLALVGVGAVLVLSLAVVLWSGPSWPAHGAVIGLLFLGLALVSYALRAVYRLTQAVGSVGRWVARLRTGNRALHTKPQPSGVVEGMRRDLNAIAGELDDLDRHTVTEIENERLAQKTRSLELLYNIAASVNVARDLDELLVRSLQALKEM
ncbi:MAG: hypothetical protein OES09_05320, partial [Gammaproteobacteria bacterium]|nr:hypothetical protein [Gammaproteobacteria bacterium]